VRVLGAGESDAGLNTKAATGLYATNAGMGYRKGLSVRQIAHLINRRIASVKNKARELGLVSLKKSESC
jgi:hypothetical protein